MSIRTYLDHQPEISAQVFVDDSAVVIGQVSLAEDVSVWPLTAIRGDVNYIRVGRGSNIQDGSVLHVTSATPENPEGFPTLIGENVTVGHKAILHGCTIHDNVLIGMGAMVLDGAVVESNVVVGAGSLVSPGKVLESGGLYLGSPARRVRELTEKEIAFFTQSAHHYIKLKNRHMQDSHTL